MGAGALCYVSIAMIAAHLTMGCTWRLTRNTKTRTALSPVRHRLEEQADFGRVCVTEARVVGQGGVAGAVQDGLEHRDEHLCPRGQVGVFEKLGEFGAELVGLALGDRPGGSGAGWPAANVVLATGAAVGELGLDGLVPCLGGGVRMADRALQLTENAPGQPRLGRVPEGQVEVQDLPPIPGRCGCAPLALPR